MAHTLEDIARISGYSRSTVSRVINGEPGVSKKAKQKIGRIIEELNFQPNQAARALAAGKMYTIGLLIPETIRFIFTDPYLQHLSSAISHACQQNDYSLILWLTEPEYERKSIQRHIQSGTVDGYIAASTDFDEPVVDALKNSNRPFVLIGSQEFKNDTSFVDVDNVLGGKIATQHLIDRGYQRIATITGPRKKGSGRDRLVGYKNAMQENQREVNQSLIAEGDFTLESGYLCAQQLIPENPDAIFIASDFMAMGAIRAIQEAGLSIPDDIALVGFDGIPQTEELQLTTVHQPTEEVGKLAVDIVLRGINEQDKDIHQVILPPSLVVRQTT